MKRIGTNTICQISTLLFLLFGMNLQGQINLDFEIEEPTCNGFANGSATANPTGGTPPYLYFWSNGQAGQTSFNLTAGNYSVTVSDANGITATGATSITEPDSISVEVTPDGDICLGSDGSWTATTMGGTSPFIYEWSTGATTQTVSGFAPGFLLVTVTDANGCKAIGGRFVNVPLMVEMVTSPLACNGDFDAGAELIITGGVDPLSYNWNTGSTDPNLPSIPAGDYAVTVTDADGCTATATGTVIAPPAITIDNVTISGQCSNDASISVLAGGGTGSLDYDWSNGATGTNLSNLTPGSYTLTITDDNNCQLDTTFQISSGIEIAITTVNPSCSGDALGSATVTALNGLAPFTYAWITGATDSTISDLTGGQYGITVTDAAGCSATGVANLVSDSNLSLELSSTPANCNGTGGTATVDNVLDGVAPFQYFWNTTPPQNTPTATNLAAGTYLVIVSDADDCQVIDSVTVASGNNLTILTQVDNATCENSSDGSIAVVQVDPNAIPPITYAWSHDPTLTTETAADLSPGTYSVTITDDEGCTGTSGDITVGFDSSIDTDILWEIDTCLGDSILVTFSELSTLTPATASILNWDWTFANGLTSTDPTVQLFTDSDTIMVTLITTNSSMCTDTVEEVIIFDLQCDLYPDTIFICENQDTTLQTTGDCPNITIFEWMPDSVIVAGGDTANPTISASENAFISVNLVNNLGCSFVEEIFVEVIDTSKQLNEPEITFTQCDSTTIDFNIDNPDINCYTWIFNYPDTAATGTGQNPNYTYPEPGTYTLAVVPNVPCLDTVFKEVLVAEPPSADFTVNVSPCTETVEVMLTDASLTPTPIDSYMWTLSDGTMSDQSNLMLEFDSCKMVEATMVIAFAENCTDTATMSFELSVFDDPPELMDTLIVCQAGDTISLNPNGETTYGYNWTPANLLDDPTAANPLATVEETTLFSVNVFDSSCGDTCSVQREVLVIVADSMMLEVPQDSTVCEPTAVSLTATTDVPVIFEWATNANFDPATQVSDDLENSSELSFTIADTTLIYTRATDQFGCVQVDSFLVANYEVQAVPQDFVNICIGDSLVSLPIANLTDNDSISYSPFNPIGTSPTESGFFTISIVNDQGCTLEEEIELNVQDISSGLNIVPNLDTILLGDEVRITATLDDNYIYQWTPETGLDDPTSNAPIAMPDSETLYNLEVVDSETECRGNGSSLICVVNNFCGDPMIYVPNTFTPNGDGLNDVFFVRGFNIDELEMVVYNRWGQQMFSTRDVNKGWDGRFEGNMVAPDVYGYYLKVRCVTGGEYETKGNVTIIR